MPAGSAAAVGSVAVGGGGFSRGGFGGSHFVGGSHFAGRGISADAAIPAAAIPASADLAIGATGHIGITAAGSGVMAVGSIIDGDEGGYPVAGPVASPAPGPCTCLTKTYTQEGLVVFADVCTKEAASAPVGGADATPASPPLKSSELTPPAPPAVDSKPDVSQAPTTNNYAGKTYQDFLAANAIAAQKN